MVSEIGSIVRYLNVQVGSTIGSGRGSNRDVGTTADGGNIIISERTSGRSSENGRSADHEIILSTDELLLGRSDTSVLAESTRVSDGQSECTFLGSTQDVESHGNLQVLYLEQR